MLLASVAVLAQVSLPVLAEPVADAQPVPVALVVLALAQASRQEPVFPLAWRREQAGLPVSPVSLRDAPRASLLEQEQPHAQEPLLVAPADLVADDSVEAQAPA